MRLRDVDKATIIYLNSIKVIDNNKKDLTLDKHEVKSLNTQYFNKHKYKFASKNIKLPVDIKEKDYILYIK
jgi:hypothetical protein